MAFLALLERLAPDERAAFLLHDVFDVGYGEIAGGARPHRVGVPSGRPPRPRARPRRAQALRRHRIGEGGAARRNSSRRWRRATSRRCSSCSRQTPPGPPTAAARPQPRRGPSPASTRIAKLVVNLREKFWAPNRTIELASINGETGLVIRDGGRLVATMSIATDGERILDVYAVVNPEKLVLAEPCHTRRVRPSSIQNRDRGDAQ